MNVKKLAIVVLIILSAAMSGCVIVPPSGYIAAPYDYRHPAQHRGHDHYRRNN